MNYAFLPARALISLSGAGIIDFLQGLISNDARVLEQNRPLYTALLSPQGRYLHDFFLLPWQEKIWLCIFILLGRLAKDGRGPDLDYAFERHWSEMVCLLQGFVWQRGEEENVLSNSFFDQASEFHFVVVI